MIVDDYTTKARDWVERAESKGLTEPGDWRVRVRGKRAGANEKLATIEDHDGTMDMGELSDLFDTIVSKRKEERDFSMLVIEGMPKGGSSPFRSFSVTMGNPDDPVLPGGLAGTEMGALAMQGMRANKLLYDFGLHVTGLLLNSMEANTQLAVALADLQARAESDDGVAKYEQMAQAVETISPTLEGLAGGFREWAEGEKVKAVTAEMERQRVAREAEEAKAAEQDGRGDA